MYTYYHFTEGIAEVEKIQLDKQQIKPSNLVFLSPKLIYILSIIIKSPFYYISFVPLHSSVYLYIRLFRIIFYYTCTKKLLLSQILSINIPF